MIKEKKKVKKRRELTFKQEMVIYVKTVLVSFLIGALISIILTYHARMEMIENMFVSKEKRIKLEQKVARQIVENSDLISSLNDKSYSIMMHVGDLYEAAGDLPKAEYAYYLASQKAPNGKYISYLKLTLVLISQNKIADAHRVIDSVDDINNLSLIRFKTRANIVLGDKYYADSKFLKAVEAFEQANYYYSKLAKRDKVVNESIKERLVKSYIETATVLIKNGYNSDAARFLKKALKYDPNNLKIQYRLAIVYADLDPLVSVSYFEPLISKIPQEIDRDFFGNVLIKAANIMDIEGNSVKAKYYRYKIHSLDVYAANKVVYKEDIDVSQDKFSIKKVLFKYRLNSSYTLINESNTDIKNLSAEFVLRDGDEVKETVTLPKCITKRRPLFSGGGSVGNLNVVFGKNIYTKRELENYYIDVYVYKVPEYKTYIGSFKVPLRTRQSSRTLVSPHL